MDQGVRRDLRALQLIIAVKKVGKDCARVGYRWIQGGQTDFFSPPTLDVVSAVPECKDPLGRLLPGCGGVEMWSTGGPHDLER